MPRNYLTSGYYALRFEVLERDNFTCQYCGQRAPNVKLEVDHKIPVEAGGEDIPENLVTSCYSCNRGKAGFIIRTRRKGSRNPVRPYLPSATPSPRQNDAVAFLQNAKSPTRPKELAKALNINVRYACVLLNVLQEKKKAVRVGRGLWEGT